MIRHINFNKLTNHFPRSFSAVFFFLPIILTTFVYLDSKRSNFVHEQVRSHLTHDDFEASDQRLSEK